MAIYHLSASIVKRSAGRSVTAAAAYRAGSKIEDLTTGIVYDYTQGKRISESNIEYRLLKRFMDNNT
jgi:seryl-tRNA(Sec) selenium transferase